MAKPGVSTARSVAHAGKSNAGLGLGSTCLFIGHSQAAPSVKGFLTSESRVRNTVSGVGKYCFRGLAEKSACTVMGGQDPLGCTLGEQEVGPELAGNVLCD